MSRKDVEKTRKKKSELSFTTKDREMFYDIYAKMFYDQIGEPKNIQNAMLRRAKTIHAVRIFENNFK